MRNLGILDISLVVEMKFIENRRDSFTPVLILFFVLIGSFFVFFRESLLPDKYSFDSSIYEYESTKTYEGGFVLFDSKENTNRLYSYLGVNGSLDSTESGSIFLFFILLFFFPLLKFKHSVITFFFVGLWYLLNCIYMIQYTKEHLALIVTSIMFAVFVSGWRYFTFYIVVAVLYSIYFRVYWVIFAGAAFYFYCVFNYFNFRRISWFFVIFGIIFMTLFLSISLDGNLSMIRYRMNEDRLGTGVANSAILPLIEGGGYVVDIINATYSYISLVFPFSLVMQGSILYFGFAIFQLSFIWLFIKSCYRNQDKTSKVALSFLVAFIFSQALFVPDYGAYLRHYMVVVPILLFVFVRNLSLTESRSITSQ